MQGGLKIKLVLGSSSRAQNLSSSRLRSTSPPQYYDALLLLRTEAMWWAGGTFKLWKELEKESGSGSGSGGGHINACGTPRVSGA